MATYLRSKYSQRVLGKFKPFERAQMKRRGHRPWPGWMGDSDKRPLRWERWRKLPQTAVDLYRRVRQRLAGYRGENEI